jgi:hypothetical protein
MSDFDLLWNDLRRKLKKGTVIKNWTAYRGYLGDTMVIQDVRRNSISIDSPNALSFQVVPVRDFQSVWTVWKDYKSQKLKRSELRDITRFSKYIISIFHWYEGEIKRNLK